MDQLINEAETLHHRRTHLSIRNKLLEDVENGGDAFISRSLPLSRRHFIAYLDSARRAAEREAESVHSYWGARNEVGELSDAVRLMVRNALNLNAAAHATLTFIGFMPEMWSVETRLPERHGFHVHQDFMSVQYGSGFFAREDLSLFPVSTKPMIEIKCHRSLRFRSRNVHSTSHALCYGFAEGIDSVDSLAATTGVLATDRRLTTCPVVQVSHFMGKGKGTASRLIYIDRCTGNPIALEHVEHGDNPWFHPREFLQLLDIADRFVHLRNDLTYKDR